MTESVSSIVGKLASHTRQCIAEVGAALSSVPPENFEETLEVLKELGTIYNQLSLISGPIAVEEEPPITPSAEEPLEEPPAETPIETQESEPVEEASERRANRRGQHPDGEYSTVQDYSPFLLRVMASRRYGRKFAELQREMVQLMKKEGALKELDEQPVGASGVLRYVAQTSSLRKQLLKQNVIVGDASKGYKLTPEGRQTAEALAPGLAVDNDAKPRRGRKPKTETVAAE